MRKRLKEAETQGVLNPDYSALESDKSRYV